MVLQLDDIDRGILHELQTNARETTAAEMADRVGTSASTVRNRIDILEEEVIRGYHPEIDYEAAGFELRIYLICRTDTSKRSTIAQELLGLPGVISVREMMTGSHNLYIDIVSTDSLSADDTIAQIEALELEIVSTQVTKDFHVQPFNHFGVDL